MSRYNLLAVDPGTRSLGWAAFTGSRLQACGVLKSKGELEMLREVQAWSRALRPLLSSSTRLVVEVPEHYPGAKSKAPPNLLAKVTFVAGGVVGALCLPDVITVVPKRWKGQVPKAVHHKRLRAVLVPGERDRTPPVSSDDTWDAIGLGLWALGRTK